MDKFDISSYHKLDDLPLQQFNSAAYSIYVLDKNWNYIFINDVVLKNLKKTREDFLGKNMWEVFPELANDAAFTQMRLNTEKGLNTNLITMSPLTSHRLNITGHPLSDCFVFTSSILPQKEELLDDLRSQLQGRRTNHQRKS